jgi:hypothetical protein
MADTIVLIMAVITLMMKSAIAMITIFSPVKTALKAIPIFLITIVRPVIAAVKIFMKIALF